MSETPASAPAPLGPEDRAWLHRMAKLTETSPLVIHERDGRKHYTKIPQRRRVLLAAIIRNAAGTEDPQKETTDVE